MLDTMWRAEVWGIELELQLLTVPPSPPPWRG
jgi:hypothetical protein